MSMTKRKHKTHRYQKGEIVYKKWFRTDVLLKHFNITADNADKRINFCNSLGVGASRAFEMMEPDYVISWSTADKYAIKLRTSSMYNMA